MMAVVAGYHAIVLLFISVAVWVLLFRKRKGAPNLPPGPVLKVPIFGNWLQVGDQITVRRLAKLAEKYGDIFMLQMGWRSVVVVSSPELAREMLATKGVEFGSRASTIVFDVFAGSGKDLAFAEYGEHWRKARRLVSGPFFSSKAVERWRGAWEREAEVLAQGLGGALQAEGVVGVRDSLQFMVYNVVYSMAFGHRFPSEADPLFRELKRLNDERARLAQTLDYNYADFHPFLRPLLWGYLRTCRRVKAARDVLFNRLISLRLEKKLKTPAPEAEAEEAFGIDLMLAAVEGGDMDADNILYILDNLNAAGIVTLSASLEWALAELVNHPNIQHKLYTEIIQVAGPNADLTMDICSKLDYLHAVIKETMRLHTSVPLIVPHLNLKAEVLGGYHIPARSKMIVNSWWLGNNPKYWKDPQQFAPERFLTDERSLEMSGNDFKFVPFGYGRRQCPGIPMAIPLMQLTLGKIVQRFEILPPPTFSQNQKIDLSEFHGQMVNMMAVAPQVVLRRRHSRC